MLLDRARKYWPVIAVLWILFYVFLNHLVENQTLVSIFGFVSVLISFGSAAYVSLKTSQMSLQTAVSRAWMFFAIGIFLWFIAYLIETIVWILSSSPISVPSVADLLSNAGSLAVVAALIAYPGSKEMIFGRIRAILDVSIICLGTFILFWLMFLRPVILLGLMDTITTIWVEARVVFDMAIGILLVRLFLITHSLHERNTFLILGAGAFLLTLTDLVSSYQELMGISMGSGYLDAGWMLVGVLFALGASSFTSRQEEKEQPLQQTQKFTRARFEPFLPLAITYTVVSFVIVDWQVSGELDQVAFPALVLIVALVVTRQGVVVGQSEMRQHAELVNSTADFAFVCDSYGRIRLANPALRAAIGVGKDEKLSTTLEDFLQIDLSVEELLNQTDVSGWNGEVEFKYSDGSTSPVSLSLKPILDDRGRERLFAAIAHDLTETINREKVLRAALDQLANTEEELRFLNQELEAKVEVRTQELEEMVVNLAELNEELKALDSMKSEFVALVSHELRAPLTNIRTGLEMMLHSKAGGGKKNQESLKLIMSETDRLSSFVEMILDLSALEAGRFQLQIREIPIEKVIEDVVYRFSNQPNSHRLIVDVPTSIPFVHADEQALQSILFHLIDNALKYAPQGNVDIKAFNTDEVVFIQVVDSGPGIPENEREHVFEMFYRLDTSDSRDIYGRGLGLNLAKRFLDLMGGGIQIKDAQGQGTVVEFWLPMAD